MFLFVFKLSKFDSPNSSTKFFCSALNKVIFSSKRDKSHGNEASEEKSDQTKTDRISRDAQPTLLPILKSRVNLKVEHRKLILGMQLVENLYYVSANVHSNRTAFKVKGLAKIKRFKQKNSYNVFRSSVS